MVVLSVYVRFPSECTCKEEGVFEEVAANKIELVVKEFDFEEKIVQAKREEISGGFHNYKRV